MDIAAFKLPVKVLTLLAWGHQPRDNSLVEGELGTRLM
jgi:hypothetical protein